MFKNHLKIALRNLWKQKIYSFINVLGLAVGMAACLLIYLFINNELGFDRFHRMGKNIYRLNEVQSFEGISPQPVPPAGRGFKRKNAGGWAQNYFA